MYQPIQTRDRELELVAGLPDAVGDQLGLERVHEALGQRVGQRRQLRLIRQVGREPVRVTHPFHPRAGREYVVVAVRLMGREDRVFFFDEDGTQRSLPLAWTDAGEVDPFVVVAAGRSAFRVSDLLAVAALIDGFSRPSWAGRP